MAMVSVLIVKLLPAPAAFLKIPDVLPHAFAPEAVAREARAEG